MPTSAIAERFLKTCRDHAGAAAVRTLSDGRSLTFGDLLEQFTAARRALEDAGVGPGACVLSLVGNRPAFFPLFAACMDAGAALLPLNEATDAEAAALVDGPARPRSSPTGRCRSTSSTKCDSRTPSASSGSRIGGSRPPTGARSCSS